MVQITGRRSVSRSCTNIQTRPLSGGQASGPQKKALERVAEELDLGDQVHFLGERQDILEILSHISIYVQASSFEGMANSLIEAIAAGCLVLVSVIDENLELVGKGERGWILEPKNPASLANVLAEALAEPQKLSHTQSRRDVMSPNYIRKRKCLTHGI